MTIQEVIERAKVFIEDCRNSGCKPIWAEEAVRYLTRMLEQEDSG